MSGMNVLRLAVITTAALLAGLAAATIAGPMGWFVAVGVWIVMAEASED